MSPFIMTYVFTIFLDKFTPSCIPVCFEDVPLKLEVKLRSCRSLFRTVNQIMEIRTGDELHCLQTSWIPLLNNERDIDFQSNLCSIATFRNN